MAYEPYANLQDYLELFPENDECCEIEQYLLQASRHIDSLTYNRIVGRGFFNLTPFQQEIIKEVTCRQAAFERENADILDNILNSYGINGVSMGFGGNSWNVFADKGVAMRKSDYAFLEQTGLTCRLAVR